MVDYDLEQPSERPWKATFFTFWTGQAFSLLGSQIVQFALIWWLTQTTRSATILTTAMLVGLLPQVIVSPFAGALVDRWKRKLVMLAADSTAALAIVVLVLLFWTGRVHVWHVYAIMLVRSVAGAFHWPAMQASTTLMVPKDQLARIQGLNQMLGGAMNIGAAPLGALLLGLLPMYGVLAIDILTAAIAVLALLAIAIPQPSRLETGSQAAPTGMRASLRQEMLAGFDYVRTWKGLVILLASAALINFLLGPASALIPILVTRHFGGGVFELAWMESAWGVGVVAGGLLLGVWGGFRKRIYTSMVGLVMLGLANLATGLTPANGFPLAVGMLFLVGFSGSITNGPLMAVIQGVVAPEMQGRVFTLMSSAASAMMPLGLIIAGPVADALGVQVWFLVGGVATALMGVSAYFMPDVVNIEEIGARRGKMLMEEAAVLEKAGG